MGGGGQLSCGREKGEGLSQTPLPTHKNKCISLNRLAFKNNHKNRHTSEISVFI